MIKTRMGYASSVVLLLALLCQMLVVPLLNVVPSAQAADSTILTTPKWTVTGQSEGESGVLIADINKDGREEVIRASSGWIRVFNGINGAILWQRSDAALSTMAKPQMADLDGDGYLDIIVNIARGVMAWRFPGGVISNGAQYWRHNDLSSNANHWSSPVVGIIDDSGHPTVFVGGEDAESGDLGGRITALRYDGTVLRQAFTWRPCFGGLSLADTDNDGHFELFQGDRKMSYNDGGYGRGVRCFWADNLTVKWERPELTCSSHIPILVDVNHDGILEVIAGQTGDTCVLDSRDGSFIRPLVHDTDAFPIHFQPSVYDIDLDGNPELLMADGHDNTADNAIVWDLTDWHLDGNVSVGKCYYGPKAADVTGDGVMELIVCSYGGVYIIDHANFTVLDSVPNLGPNTYATRLTYAVVNDIDGDNLVELVVSSYSGSIWAFDTRAPKPNPRARSEVQHYSEMRLGAAEYVGPPRNTTNPLILNAFPSDKSANVSVALSALRFTMGDYQLNPMSYSVTTTPNIGSRSGTNVANGTTISLVPNPSPLSYSTTHTWRVEVTDSAAHLTSRTFTFRTEFAPVSNTAPTQGTPLLISSSTPPAAGDILTCFNQSTYDANGNAVTNIYNWYRDDVSLTSLLLPFDTRNEVTAKDYSGYNNHGTVNGATWTAAGRVGGCYEFPSGGNIIVPYSTSLDGGGTWSEITVEHWIYFSVDQDGTRTIAKTFSYEIGFQSGSLDRLYATIWTRSDPFNAYRATSTYTLSNNTWYHVVMTYKDGVGLFLYVNGVLRASRTDRVGLIQSGAALGPFLGQNSPEPLYIGWYNSFRGKIDEVRIYPKALSQAQISQRYSETSGASSKLTSSEALPGVWKCQVTPNDRYADGNAKVSNTTILSDRPPTASNLRFTSRTGLQFLTTDDLHIAYDYSDPDGDKEAGTEIRWYRNGALQTSMNNVLVVPQTATSTGDTWYFTVRPGDGKIFGANQTSSSVTIIQNIAPTQGTPSISGVNDDANIVCTPQATADGENDEVANIYNWYRNGVSFTNLLLPLDTNNGITAEDYSGYNNDGTSYGATWASNGIVGGAYSFNGDDVITVADSASLGNAGSWSQIAVEYWVYPSVDQRGARILNKNGGAAGDSGKYMTGINTDASGPANVVFFGVTVGDEYEETYNNTATVIPTGSWSHIVGTYKSGEGIRLYINGVLKSSTDGITGNIDASAGEPLFVGYASAIGGTANRYFKGSLDEIRIYPAALSVAQIFQNYIDQKGGISSTATIVPEETSVGQTWRCQVTPNDGWQDGTMRTTSQITVTTGDVLFSDGFESGSFGAWTAVSGSPVVQSSITHDGTYAMRAAGSGRSCYLAIAESTVNMRAYFYVDAASASVELMRFTAGSNIVSFVKRTSAGALQLAYLRVGSLVYLTSAAGTLPLDSWHCIELRAVVGASGAYSFWLDGVEIAAFHITGVDNDNFGVITRAYVGCIYSSGTAVDVDVDCVVISNTYIAPEEPSTQYALSISTVGSGSVTKSPNKTSYASGESVVLTAVPAAGSSFAGWSGAFSSTADPVTVIINGTTSVTATFTVDGHTLTIVIVGPGSVSTNPNKMSYSDGETVTITAIPQNTNFRFDHWGGALTGTANPATIVMNSDKTVYVYFLRN